MAELIALLMVTVGQLLGSGAPPADMAEQVTSTLEQNSPFTVEAIEVNIAAEDPGDLPEGYKPAGDTFRLEFSFTDIEIEPLLIHDLDISVGGICAGPEGTLTLGSIDFEALIEDSALEEALKSHAPSIKGPSLKIRNRGITLAGSYQTWLAAVPFSVDGGLRVANQTQLVFEIDKSSMAGIGIPEAVNNLIEGEVNPVYDLQDFVKRSKKDIERAKDQLDYEFFLEVSRLKPKNGHIIVAGTA